METPDYAAFADITPLTAYAAYRARIRLICYRSIAPDVSTNERQCRRTVSAAGQMV